MVSELDRWRAAQQLIKQHGLAAEMGAAQRADAANAAGDRAGESLWRDVMSKIRMLQRAQRAPGALSN